uniref:CPBP family intramembrane glutamic endopeptidase n=1 Tax=Acetatifactor sp. TaxID=1872090 RepID=UPI004056AF57
MSLLPEALIADYANNVNQKFGVVTIVAVLAQVVAAPVVEEVIFRGLMLSRLRKGMPTIVAVLITSVIFGLIHGQILWMAYTFVLGLIFAAVAIKTNSILSTILLHAVFNGAGVILSLITVDIPVLVYIVLTIVGAVVTFGAIYVFLKKQPEAKAQAEMV